MEASSLIVLPHSLTLVNSLSLAGTRTPATLCSTHPHHHPHTPPPPPPLLSSMMLQTIIEDVELVLEPTPPRTPELILRLEAQLAKLLRKRRRRRRRRSSGAQDTDTKKRK